MSRPQHLAAIVGRRHALYRFFDDQDVLLYVGITHNLPNRMTNHRAKKPWWEDIADMRVQWFPDRKAVFAAEKAAIKTEKPLYNIDHNDEVYRDPFVQLTTEEKLAYLSPIERDWLEVPAYDAGRRELADYLLSDFTEIQRDRFFRLGRERGERDGEDGLDGPEAIVRALYAAIRWTRVDVALLSYAADLLVGQLPPDVIDDADGEPSLGWDSEEITDERRAARRIEHAAVLLARRNLEGLDAVERDLVLHEAREACPDPNHADEVLLEAGLRAVARANSVAAAPSPFEEVGDSVA